MAGIILRKETNIMNNNQKAEIEDEIIKILWNMKMQCGGLTEASRSDIAVLKKKLLSRNN